VGGVKGRLGWGVKQKQKHRGVGWWDEQGCREACRGAAMERLLSCLDSLGPAAQKNPKRAPPPLPPA
jgi:hypothetical protein